MPTASTARGTYKSGGGRFARPADLPSRSVSRSTPNLSASAHSGLSTSGRVPGTTTPTHHDCGATRPGSYTFRARPMPSFNLHDAVPPSHARSQYRKQLSGRRPPYAVEGDVHHGVPFYPPSLHPESAEAIARLQRIREARRLYKTPASRKANARSIDDLLKATRPDRQPCSAVRHSQPYSERIHNLSASVPMHLHRVGRDHEHGHRRFGSATSGDSSDGDAFGRWRTVSSDALVDDERGMALTEATQTDVALSADSLNESVRSDVAVGPDFGTLYIDTACGTDRTPVADLRDASVDVSENCLAGRDSNASFTLHPDIHWTREADAEAFPTILETDRELQTTTSTTDNVDYVDFTAKAQAELAELRRIGSGNRSIPKIDITAELAEAEKGCNDEEDTMTEPVTSSVGARSSILDSDSDVDAKDLGEEGPRTMSADIADLRHVEKRRSSLLKVASGEDTGRDSGSEYYLLPGDQSISSELPLTPLDNRVAEWHHKSIFYQSVPIDGGAESAAVGSEGIRVSAVQVSTMRVVRNPNARFEPPDLPVVVSSLTYPMRQLYPLPYSNHFLSGPGPKIPGARGVRITDSCLVYENKKSDQNRDPLLWTVNDRRELLDGAMAERRSDTRPVLAAAKNDAKVRSRPGPKTGRRPGPGSSTGQEQELHGAPDVIPRARSPLDPQSRAVRPDRLNIVPNYPAVYLGSSERPKKPSALEFWQQREAAGRMRNALNTSVGHAFD